MNELETQVAKIQIGNQKQATTHVLLMSEEALHSEAELFVVTELPMFNPAAFSDCEQIAQAVAATLKRSYRKAVNESSFETALAHINEELGKLASIGKTHWVGKLNALVAVKHNQSLSLATTGKTSALLFRDGQFASISEYSKTTHPLKTFENFSVGKLKLNDILILSTSQLLNHISIDRLKNIIHDNTLPMAAEQAIAIMEENAGPEIACGTLIIQLIEGGSLAEEQVDLEQYTEGPHLRSETFGEGAKKFAQGAFFHARPMLVKCGAFLKQNFESMRKRIKNKNFIPRSQSVLMTMKTGIRKASANFDREKFQSYSKQKKFFLISASVLLIALVINISLSTRQRRASEQNNAWSQEQVGLESLLADADAALVYRDEPKTKELLEIFTARLSTFTELSETQSLKKTELEHKANELISRLENSTSVAATFVATLSPTNTLIKLPSYLATQTGDTIVSYNTQSGTTEDNTIRANDSLLLSTAANETTVAIHNGTSLAVWNPKTGKVDRYYSQNVPAGTDIVGMRHYGANKRVYTINKNTGQVVSFLLTDRGFSNPLVSVGNIPNAAGASDLAIDGSIYIYLNGEIAKYNAGKPAEFNQPILLKPISPAGKLYTENGWNGLYVLDPDNNRILILNKTGEIIQSLVSNDFKNMKDFFVDESAKTIYILAESNLLKVNF
jgi:hypothetical protein